MTARLEDLHRSLGRHLRAEGRSERTVVIYGQSITFFSRWLVDQGREATVEELNRCAIREWLAQLADINEASTVKTRYRGLFRFCGWLAEEDELPENPMKTLKPPEPTSRPVPALSDAEVRVRDAWCPAEVRPWSPSASGWRANCSGHPATGVTQLGAFHEDDVRPDTVDRSYGRDA